MQRKDILGEMAHPKVFAGKGWNVKKLHVAPFGRRVRVCVSGGQLAWRGRAGPTAEGCECVSNPARGGVTVGIWAGQHHLRWTEGN